jgi:hypothetical protein
MKLARLREMPVGEGGWIATVDNQRTRPVAGFPQVQADGRRRRFRRTADLVSYDFRDENELIRDFFATVEQACRQEGMLFEFETAKKILPMKSSIGAPRHGRGTVAGRVIARVARPARGAASPASGEHLAHLDCDNR